MDGDFDLPEAVRDVAAVVGRENALRLVGAVVPWPGRRQTDVHVTPRRQTDMHVTPRRELGDDHMAVRALGRDIAEQLRASQPKGRRFRLTPCTDVYQRFRDDSIRRLHRDEGINAKTLCDWFELTDRRVRDILKAGADAT